MSGLVSPFIKWKDGSALYAILYARTKKQSRRQKNFAEHVVYVSNHKQSMIGKQRNVWEGNLWFYYIHFEITGDPWNLIGCQQYDLFTNHTIFCSKSHLFQMASFMF